MDRFIGWPLAKKPGKYRIKALFKLKIIFGDRDYTKPHQPNAWPGAVGTVPIIPPRISIL